MNKLFLFALFSAVIVRFTTEQPRYIARQGQVSFFSYTSVENIEAKNIISEMSKIYPEPKPVNALPSVFETIRQ